MKNRYILTIDGSIKVMFESGSNNIKKTIGKMMCWADKKTQLHTGLFRAIVPSPVGGYIETGKDILVWLPGATTVSWVRAVYDDQLGSWREEL